MLRDAHEDRVRSARNCQQGDLVFPGSDSGQRLMSVAGAPVATAGGCPRGLPSFLSWLYGKLQDMGT